MHISKDSEGYYLCEAKNEVGTGVSKVIFLKVNGKQFRGSVVTKLNECSHSQSFVAYASF
jgi:hypothetical protein